MRAPSCMQQLGGQHGQWATPRPLLILSRVRRARVSKQPVGSASGNRGVDLGVDLAGRELTGTPSKGKSSGKLRIHSFPRPGHPAPQLTGTIEVA